MCVRHWRREDAAHHLERAAITRDLGDTKEPKDAEQPYLPEVDRGREEEGEDDHEVDEDHWPEGEAEASEEGSAVSRGRGA